MTSFIADMVSVSEKILLNALSEFGEQKYADAESSADAALDGFLLAEQDGFSLEKVSPAIDQCRKLMREARKLWIESGQSPSPEFMDHLRIQVAADVRSFSKGLDNAVREAQRSEKSGIS